MSLRDDIRRHEGLRLIPYRCTEGYWTIGIGHKISDDKTITYDVACRLSGAPWTESQSYDQCDRDIAAKQREVDRYLPSLCNWPPAWQEAAVEMAFQMGTEGLLGFKKLIRCANEGDGQGAHAAALDSKWAREDTPERAAEVAAKFLK